MNDQEPFLHFFKSNDHGESGLAAQENKENRHIICTTRDKQNIYFWHNVSMELVCVIGWCERVIESPEPFLSTTTKDGDSDGREC